MSKVTRRHKVPARLIINCAPGAHSVVTPDLLVTERCNEGLQCLCSSDVDVVICPAKSAVRRSDGLATAAFANSSLRAQVAQMCAPTWRGNFDLTRSNTETQKLEFVSGRLRF
jgi:hypothetical protein